MAIGDLLAVGWRAISLRIVDLGVVVVATLVALALLNRIAPKFDLLDLPDGDRKAHATAVPLTGGLALVIGIWIGALFATKFGQIDIRQVDYEVLALLGIIATVHAFDDQSGLSARQRLVIDAVVALAFIVVTQGVIESFGTMWGAELLFGWFGVPLTIFIYLALSNAYNMIDGVDGLALTQFLIAIVSVALWHILHAQDSGFEPLAFSVIAACLVVLAANLGFVGQRYVCFLGDTWVTADRDFSVFFLYMCWSRRERACSHRPRAATSSHCRCLICAPSLQSGYARVTRQCRPTGATCTISSLTRERPGVPHCC